MVVLLLIAVNCRHRIRLKFVSHLTLQAVHHRIEKDAYHYMVSANERAPLVLQGEQAECVHSVKPTGEVVEEVQYLSPA